MTVYLTSFKRYFESLDTTRIPGYSIAVYQPSWYPQLPKLDLFDIRDKGGKWVRPRNFIDDTSTPGFVDKGLLRRYHDTLLGMYQERWYQASDPKFYAPHRALDEALGWDGWGYTKDVVFCCWCPHDKAARRQLKDYGSFVCHSWPIETFLKELGVEVVRDADREKMVRL